VHLFIDYYNSQAYEEEDRPKDKSLIRGRSTRTDDPGFIRSQVIQAMMAAQDTTSELIADVLFLLARHPKYWNSFVPSL
jgi:cytochrome P450